mgnify:CR=1 FL=1|tara:strand:- start:1649 stop:2056 length:408 start_codon:yes stop_codon:yes gene_type:complete
MKMGIYSRFIMIKKSILFILLIITIASCNIYKTSRELNFFELKRKSQDENSISVYGTIFDKYDRFGLKYSEIKLTNLKNEYSTQSDKKGNFNFLNIEEGEYILKANHLGYYSFKDTLKVKYKEVLVIKIGLGYDE